MRIHIHIYNIIHVNIYIYIYIIYVYIRSLCGRPHSLPLPQALGGWPRPHPEASQQAGVLARTPANLRAASPSIQGPSVGAPPGPQLK